MLSSGLFKGLNYIITICLLFGVTTCLQAKQKESFELVTISNLKENYNSGDTIQFIISNNINDILFYSISFDEKIAESWVSLLPDVYTSLYDRHQALNLKILNSEDEVRCKFNAKDILSIVGYHPYGLCRFSVEIRTNPWQKGQWFSTTSFLID